jgi:hypothetical protein
MTNKKIIYFNIISIAILLLYMALHLYLAEGGIQYVQGSGGGFLYAKFDFFGPHIIDINGDESRSLISPSILMSILLFFNFVFILKYKFSKQVLLNILFLILTLFFYHKFLNDLNSSLEVAVRSNSFWLRELNFFSYEFFDNIEKTDVKGYNYSVFPIIISIIYNASRLVSRKETDDNKDCSFRAL